MILMAIINIVNDLNNQPIKANTHTKSVTDYLIVPFHVLYSPDKCVNRQSKERIF